MNSVWDFKIFKCRRSIWRYFPFPVDIERDSYHWKRNLFIYKKTIRKWKPGTFIRILPKYFTAKYLNFVIWLLKECPFFELHMSVKNFFQKFVSKNTNVNNTHLEHIETISISQTTSPLLILNILVRRLEHNFLIDNYTGKYA